MISIECECGKVLKVKDDVAGKQVRCPVCMATVSVPASDAPDGNEWDQWDEMGETGAGAPASSSNARNRRGKRTGGGLKWGMKAVVGMLAIIIGAAMGIFICYNVFQGNGFAGMRRGLVMSAVFICFGIAWIKGETFGS